ncbi:MAG: hypothetical protein RL173_507 [Fibrobacterota bacterium]|jgi:glycosyltransferase involved in cell wall biosynthesis
MKPGTKKRPRVAVLTQNCFAQCDLPVLPGIVADADVKWTVFYPRDDKVGYPETELEDAGRAAGADTQVVRMQYRLRTWAGAMELRRILSDLRRFRPDTLYVNAVGMPWLAILVRAMFPPRKVVWAIHDVQDHHFKKLHHPQTLYRKFLYNAFKRFHFLSRGQESIFKSIYPGKTTFFAPIAPTDFGPRSCEPSSSPFRFLFFGFIAPRKGVDVLIDAAEELHRRGVDGFRIAIAGKCSDWGPYQARIRTSELFELDIRPVPNDVVRDLFSRSHWLVLPYRDITQSGPMSLAMHYSVPTISSDLDGFREFVQEGRTGLFFKLDDPISLADSMEHAMRSGTWETTRTMQASWFQENFSLDRCVELYRSFLLPPGNHAGQV